MKILFDLDGTLINSAVMISTILNRQRRERGHSDLELEDYKKLISLGATRLIEVALQCEDHEIQSELQLFRTQYRAVITPSTAVYDGAEKALKYLVQRKHLIGLCSNKPESLCKKTLKDVGLIQYFTVIAGGDTYMHPKPAPDSAIGICDALGQSNGPVFYIGDSSIDQQTAHNIDAKFIFFKPGYNDGVNEDAVEYAIDSLVELIILRNKAGELVF